MIGQMNISDFIPCVPQPGDWFDEGDEGVFHLGEAISFDDIKPGMLIWANKRTQSSPYWKCLFAEEQVETEQGKRWIMYDGTRTRELHDKKYWERSGEVWYRRVDTQKTKREEENEN